MQTNDLSPMVNRVYMELKERIVTFRLVPGTLLQEVDIGREFGVSRTPVREALRILQREGLVTSVPRKGAQVASPSFQEVAEAYQVRELLEPPMAAVAAGRIDEGQLAHLEEILRQCPVSPRSHEEAGAVEKADGEFHRLIMEIAGNQLIERIVGEARLRCARLAYFVSPARYERSSAEHFAILRALRDRDGARAEMLMREHIRAARARLFGLPAATRGVAY